jgi:hypothetical protein
VFDDFDFTLLDDPDFKEDSVREELLVPLLKKLGYSASGECGIIRSKSITHPFVMIGTQQRKINIIPDYILTYKKHPLVVIDAKAPDKELIKSKHAEQAFSYAIHPEVRVFRYALFNGRQLVVYDVDKFEPILIVDAWDIESRWKDVELALSADMVLNPEKANFAADLGLWMKKSGMDMDGVQSFVPMGIHEISMYELGQYTSFSVFENFGDQRVGTSADYTQEQLDQMLSIVSNEKREVIKAGLSRQPYRVELKVPIQVVMTTRMGELQHGPYEDYIPLVVTDIDVNNSKKMNDIYEKCGTHNPKETS